MLNVQTHHSSPAIAVINAQSAAPSSSSQCSLLGPEATLMTFAQREIIYLEGDPADHLFIIRTGTVKVYKSLPDGRCQVTGFLFTGDLFGLQVNDAYAYGVEAITETIVEGLARRRVDAAFDRDPVLRRTFVTSLASELVTAQEQMLLLGRRSAHEKLAWFLLKLAERYATSDDSNIIHVPMRGVDIADYLGLTAETVSRTLSQFKRDGLVRPLPSRNLRLDSDALEDIVYGKLPASMARRIRKVA